MSLNSLKEWRNFLEFIQPVGFYTRILISAQLNSTLVYSLKTCRVPQVTWRISTDFLYRVVVFWFFSDVLKTEITILNSLHDLLCRTNFHFWQDDGIESLVLWLERSIWPGWARLAQGWCSFLRVHSTSRIFYSYNDQRTVEFHVGVFTQKLPSSSSNLNNLKGFSFSDCCVLVLVRCVGNGRGLFQIS